MSGIYDDLEESLLREFKSSTKESLEDIALDSEEKERIIYNISGSLKVKLPELRVDYSDFSNHVFFGSAYSSVNYAFARILEYPIDGELKDKNVWHDNNTGYENWFFDKFPKNHGHIFLTSGSNSPSIYLKDYENKLNFDTGSFTIEALIKPYEINGTNLIMTLFSGSSLSQEYIAVQIFDKNIGIGLAREGPATFIFSPYDSYISSSHMVSIVYNSELKLLTLYVDGEQIETASITGHSTGSYNFGAPTMTIGYAQVSGVNYHFSGAVDEVRIWKTARTEEQIKRTYFKTIHANQSDGLVLYYKFNEPWLTSSEKNQVIDYSGNKLDGTFSGSFNPSLNYKSGSFASWFKDSGDLVLDTTNSDVVNFVTEQRNSGSRYDDNNSNYIFELVPHFMIDDEGTQEQKSFLLLLARHWDLLKLYIENLSNIFNINLSKYNDTPNDFLNLIAKHYGLNIGSIYESTDPLQYFYGENILSSGSLDSPLKDVRDQLKRNIVNNLIYLYKSKSTREAIKAALRTIGLDDSIVNINEYSTLSGGIKSRFEAKTVEKKSLRIKNLDEYIVLHSQSYSPTESRNYEFRFSFHSASYTGSMLSTTSSIFRSRHNANDIFYATFMRENPSSSFGRIAVHHSAAASYISLTSSLFEALNGNSFLLSVYREPINQRFGFNIGTIQGDKIDFHYSSSQVSSDIYKTTASVDSYIGTIISDDQFFGYINEIRVWQKGEISASALDFHIKDFESIALDDFQNEIDSKKLLLHHKLYSLSEFSRSTTQILDSSGNGKHSTYEWSSGFEELTSSLEGVFLRKLEPSYTYDFTIDNDKIRLHDSDKFTKNDINKDVPFLSIDFSPISFLNKEIIKSFGEIEKFSNIIGFPYLKYRDEVTELNAYRYKFFNEKINQSIDYSVYFDIIKWFDANFSYFLSQLIPLDVTPSLSNFVIEPNLFEFNKVKHIYPYADTDNSYTIEGTISSSIVLTASAAGYEVSLADPGRFGAALSASGEINSLLINYSSSLSGTNGVNYSDPFYKKILNDHFSESNGHGNGFYTFEITCSSYEKNVLNAIEKFNLTGVHYTGDSINSNYLSSSQGRPTNTHFTGTFIGVQDSRWLWNDFVASDNDFGPKFDHGLGYGGGYGQLWMIANKSIIGNRIGSDFQIGSRSYLLNALPEKYIEVFVDEKESSKVVLLWPQNGNFDGVKLHSLGGPKNAKFDDGTIVTETFGNIIEIEDFTTLNVNIIGKVSMNSGGTPSVIINMVFQFLDGDEMPHAGFETILSSSFSSNMFVTKNVGHFYEITPRFSSNFDFVENFQRELPRMKKMRIYVDFDFSLSDPGIYNILIKGVLSKKNASKDILNIRQS